MAKLTMPLMSLEAAGKLGDNLLIQTWKGRPYVRVLHKPVSTPSARQRGLRQIWALCCAYWPLMSADLQAQWEAVPGSRHLSGLHKMIAHNIERANADQIPLADPPPSDPYFVPAGQQLTFTPNPLGNLLKLSDTFAWGDAYAWLIYRSPNPGRPTDFDNAGVTRTTQTLVAALPAGITEHVDRQDDPDDTFLYSALLVGPNAFASFIVKGK